MAEVECGDGVDLQLRQRLKALPFVSTSAVLLLVTANADTHLVADPRRHPVSNVRWQTCRRPMDVALRGAIRPHDGRATSLRSAEQPCPVAQYNVKATGHVAKLRRDLSL